VHVRIICWLEAELRCFLSGTIDCFRLSADAIAKGALYLLLGMRSSQNSRSSRELLVAQLLFYRCLECAHYQRLPTMPVERLHAT